MPSHRRAVTRDARTTVTTRRAVNEHGTVIVEGRGSNEQRHVVEYATGVREVFAPLPEGTTLPVEMDRLHSRGNCWRLTAVGPTSRGAAHDDAAETTRRTERERRPLATQ
ncbi:hypothetical protein [Salinigranum marinum]|uniref:hypothetical protein n=1 Tax=Salinigranum marinum TaxID=1515595 RepID=UPI002989CE39|nr:hypothetical protein [Salinigranum marinum]